MTDEELMARLQLGRLLHRQAADRIEALTAKVKLMDDLDAINGEKIEDLEDKLEKAVEALEKIAVHQDYRLPKPQDIARAALEKLKGESQDGQ